MDFIWQHAPALVVAIPLFAAFATPLIGRLGSRWRALWVGLCMTLTAAAAGVLAYRVFTSGPAVYVFGALSSTLAVPPDSGGIPIRIIFQVDAFSAVMTLAIALVSFCITIYSLISDADSSGLDSFYPLLFLMVAGVFGMVCTNDLFNFFVFLEISSLAGAALVAFRVDRGVAVEAGLKYALLSAVGALCVLIAVGLLFAQYNTLNISCLAQRLQFTILDRIALVLLLAPLAMKCGTAPMHFWAPDAYTAAPASITALLVVVSQASLYAVIRILFTLYGAPQLDLGALGWLLIVLGVLTMVVGVTMALPQSDIKRLLAYLAISQTGYMLMALGVGLAVLGDPVRLQAFGTMAMGGGIFHLLNGAIYESLLFLAAGVIFYRTGTRNLNQLGGLGHSLPWTMGFFMIGGAAITGLPPFNGFASKLMIYQSVFKFNPLLAIIALMVSILTLAAFIKIFHSAFMGGRRQEFAAVQEAPWSMQAGMALLGVVVVLFGVFPAPVIDRLIMPAVTALVERGGYIAAIMGGG